MNIQTNFKTKKRKKSDSKIRFSSYILTNQIIYSLKGIQIYILFKNISIRISDLNHNIWCFRYKLQYLTSNRSQHFPSIFVKYFDIFDRRSLIISKQHHSKTSIFISCHRRPFLFDKRHSHISTN